MSMSSNSKSRSPINSRRKPINRHEHYSLCSSMAFATIEEKKASAMKLLKAVDLKSDRHFKNRKRGSVSTMQIGDSVDLSVGRQKKDQKDSFQNRNSGGNHQATRGSSTAKNYSPIKRINTAKSVQSSSSNLMMLRKRPASSSANINQSTMASSNNNKNNSSSRFYSLRRRLQAPTYSTPNLNNYAVESR